MENIDKTKISDTKNILSFQAAIVEDEAEVLTYLQKTLTHSFHANQVDVSFDIFTSGNRFLEKIQDHYRYDIIFLDIEMPEIDGIEICRRIRQIAPDALVVFISGKDELVFQTFEVQPFRFIRKSQYAQQLHTLTKDCIAQLIKKNRNMIQIIEPHSGDIYSFDINTIQFIEAAGKNCNIHTTTESVVIGCKFMDIENLLSGYSFLKPHRSYLVNCSCIFHIGKTSLELTDHTSIPISRNKVDEIKKQFLKYSTHI